MEEAYEIFIIIFLFFCFFGMGVGERRVQTKGLTCQFC